MDTEAPPEKPFGPGFAISLYLVAFVTGAIVMSFEMLGSRYLAPSFGAGIYTWASLISTVLAALCVGYFVGGYVADRYPSLAVLGATVAIGSAYLLLLPIFADMSCNFSPGKSTTSSGAASPPRWPSCCFRLRSSECIHRSRSGF